MDFTTVQTIHPSGILLLYSELDRILRMIDNPLRIRHKRSQIAKTNNILQQLEFGRLFGDDRKDDFDDEDIIHWCLSTGTLADGKSGGTLLERCEGRLSDGIKKGLYNGIVETMTNTVHHAYQDIRKDGCPRYSHSRWWMLSEERNDKLTVAICDLGIGIPRSLPNSSIFDRSRFSEIMASLRGKSDLAAIKAAIEFGRTRTGLANRGKGLPQILDAVGSAVAGYVTISSNKGIYRISADDAAAIEIQATTSILGTLIQWQVPTATSDASQRFVDDEPFGTEND